MPDFKVRTYEENREVTADKLEFCPDGVRFYTGDRCTAAFSRYLWVEEVIAKAEEPGPQPEMDEPTETAPVEEA